MHGEFVADARCGTRQEQGVGDLGLGKARLFLVLTLAQAGFPAAASEAGGKGFHFGGVVLHPGQPVVLHGYFQRFPGSDLGQPFQFVVTVDQGKDLAGTYSQRLQQR